MADFWIDLKKVPLPNLADLASLSGVAEIEPRIQFHVTVDLPRVQQPLNGLVLSLPDTRRHGINDIVLRRGSYFSPSRRREVIVNDAFARAHNLQPGESIHLLINNRRQELLIAGTAISSEFVYLLGPGTIAPDPTHFGLFYVKRSFAEDVFDFDGAANQIVGLFTPEARGKSNVVLRKAESLLEPYGVFSSISRDNQVSNRFLWMKFKGWVFFMEFCQPSF